MCICINCIYIQNCSTYSDIKKQHKSRIVKSKDLFNPAHPIIHVNINQTNFYTEIDWDIVECLSFVDSPGQWMNITQELRI